MFNDATFEDQFQTLANQAFTQWEATRPKASRYWKKFFGDGVFTAPQKLIEKVVDAVAKPDPTKLGATATLASGAGAGAWRLGGLAAGGLAAAGAGFVVAVIFHAAGTGAKIYRDRRESPSRCKSSMSCRG